MGFVFFDTETTGLQFGFDQIIQFAAIRTDKDLNEIERFEVRSRINPNVVPHPMAMLTNGLPIEELTNRNLPSHYQMMCAVNAKLLSWSPSIFIGYNSIRFDEEMLRHALFQTLHPAYLTSCHRNGRNDAFGLALAAHASNEECIVVPRKDDGKPSFKLVDLAHANGIEIKNAHDALSDTIATMQICRKVKERSTSLWQRFNRFSYKAAVSDFVGSGDGFLLTEFFANKAYHTPVVSIGEDPDQFNGRLCLDLTRDIDQLASLPDEELRNQLYHKPNPIRKIRTNAAPTLTPLWEVPNTIFSFNEINEIEAKAEHVFNDQGLKERLVRVFIESRQSFPEPKSVEEMLYPDFPSPTDEAIIRTFHQAPWSERYNIVQSIADARLKEFGIRLLGFESRSSLAPDIRNRVDQKIADCLVNKESGRLTLSLGLEEVDKLISEESMNSQMVELINNFRTHIENRISRVSAFQAKTSID